MKNDMMILPDIYLLSGFAYQIHQNVYGIDIPKENRLVLIDCGLDEEDRKVIRQTEEIWGLTGRKVTEVFLTHSHFDHAGNAAFFEREGAVLYAGARDAESIEAGDEHTITFAYAREFPACQSVRRLNDGDTVTLAPDYELRCFHTPGHTPGSMCYELSHRGRKTLFTGDFLQAGEEDGSVRLGIRVDAGYCYRDLLSSVRRMMKNESGSLLAGHFRPYLRPARELIQAAYRELLVNRDRYSD